MTWESAIRLVTDPVGRFLNDKNSITADPNDPNFLYAVWDRLQSSEGSIVNPDTVIGLGFKGPIYFTRTTNGGDLIPDVAVNPVNGNLYAVWMDTRFDRPLSPTGHDSIACTQSTDGGTTWSAPIKVNKTPTTEPNDDQQAFTPSIHVDGNGTVVVTYYDFRPTPGATGRLHGPCSVKPSTRASS